MSTGTNKERLTQNNGIINENNSDLTALKTRINNLPTSGDTTATASDIALGKTAVSKGVKITGTYEETKAVLPNGIVFGEGKSATTDFSWLADVDTSNLTNTVTMFHRLDNLTSIPLFNTENVTNMAYMFSGCSSLETVPQLDTNKVTSFSTCFDSCTSLSNESLNNILAMCINSAVTSNKTLHRIGLSSTQATTCQTLSNWDAFVAAGWSTGF